MKLIADAGATKTDWRILTDDGRVRRSVTGGFNAAVQRGELEITLPEGEIKEFFFYGAGLTSPEKCVFVEKKLKGLSGTENVYVASDLVGAARALLGHSQGIACILGTGSNCCRWDGERVVRNIRPGGYILGDEGSGAYLGLRLLADFIKGLTPPEITSVLSGSFGLDYETVVKNVYGGTAPSGYIASFVPVIEENISHPYCRELVTEGFDSFIRRNILPYGNDKLPLAFTGSIAAVFRDILTERVEAAGYAISSILPSPADGLCRYHWNEVMH